MTQEKGTGRFFAREATGLVREASLWDTLVFNFAASGPPGITLAYGLMWALVAFPGANLMQAFWITFLLGFPFLITFALLVATMPRSGGDYVYISRIVHPILGLFSNATMWITNIVWVGFLLYLTVQSTLAPPLAILGHLANIPMLITLASWMSTPNGIAIVATLLTIVVTGVMIMGMRTTLNVNSILIYIATFGMVLMILAMAFGSQTAFIERFNVFAQPFTGEANTYQAIQTIAEQEGLVIPKPWAPFTRTWATVPILITLFWFTFVSSYISGEVKGVGSRRRSLAVMLLPYITATPVLIGAFWAVLRLVGSDFLTSFYYLFNAVPDKYPLPVAPYAMLFAGLASGNVIVNWIINLTFLVWGIPVILVAMLMLNRDVFAWAFDGMVPFGLADVSERFHTPVKSILLVSFLCWVYMLVSTYTTGIWLTLAIIPFITGMSFPCNALTGVLFPFVKRKLYEASPAKWEIAGIPVVSITGAVMFISWAAIYGNYFVFPELGQLGGAKGALVTLVVWVLIVVVWYYVARAVRRRQGIDLELTFKEIPPE